MDDTFSNLSIHPHLSHVRTRKNVSEFHVRGCVSPFLLIPAPPPPPPILLHTATHSMFLIILISPFAHLDVTYDPACINGILFEDKLAVCTMYIIRFAPLFAGVFEEE